MKRVIDVMEREIALAMSAKILIHVVYAKEMAWWIWHSKNTGNVVKGIGNALESRG